MAPAVIANSTAANQMKWLSSFPSTALTAAETALTSCREATCVLAEVPALRFEGDTAEVFFDGFSESLLCGAP